MSADVWIERAACSHCGHSPERSELNVTYNLSSMLYAAGFVGWPDILAMSPREAGAHILKVLDGMAADPEKWRAMNPTNGWGDYDGCLQGRMRRWAVECTEAGPDDRIGGWL